MEPLGWIAVAVMLLSILLIPLGLPGLWIMVAVVGVGAFLGQLGPGIVILVLAVAAAAELVEFLIVRRMNIRYGGSNRAFWGAILGGTLGLLIGLPVPVIGSLVAGILGTFLGAGAVALYESRDVRAAGRVGWGVVLARVFAAFVKVAAAIVILVVGGTAWVVA